MAPLVSCVVGAIDDTFAFPASRLFSCVRKCASCLTLVSSLATDTTTRRNVLEDLHHDHILRYHAVRDAGILYIPMEYCSGGDLSTIIKQATKQNRPIRRAQILYRDLRRSSYLPQPIVSLIIIIIQYFQTRTTRAHRGEFREHLCWSTSLPSSDPHIFLKDSILDVTCADAREGVRLQIRHLVLGWSDT